VVMAEAKEVMAAVAEAMAAADTEECRAAMAAVDMVDSLDMEAVTNRVVTEVDSSHTVAVTQRPAMEACLLVDIAPPLEVMVLPVVMAQPVEATNAKVAMEAIPMEVR